MKNIFCLLTFIFLFSQAWGQYNFKHLNIESGLPSNTVRQIIEDQEGYIWLATWNGIAQFDSRRIKTFSTQNSGLKDDVINCLKEDPENNMIYVGTRSGGLHILDKLTHEIEPIIPQIKGQINVISVGADARSLWVGTNEGLYQISFLRNSSLSSIKHFHRDNSGLNNNEITALNLDHKGNLWVGTTSGAYVRKVGRNNFEHLAPASEIFAETSITAILSNDQGQIFISSLYGLYLLNEEGKLLQRWYSVIGEPNSLPHNIVKDLKFDKNQNIWIGTLGGLSYFDVSHQTFSNTAQMSQSSNRLASDFVSTLCISDSEMLWIGFDQAGADFANLSPSAIQTIKAGPGSLNNGLVNAICEDGDHILVGTSGGGLHVFNAQNHHLIAILDAVNSPIGNFISSLLNLGNGDFLIGTWGLGAWIYNTKSGRFKAIAGFEKASPYISYLNRCADGKILLSSPVGIFELERPSSQGGQIRIYPPTATIKNVGIVMEDAQNNLWVGTTSGLFRWNSHKQQLIQVNSEYISSLVTAKEGNGIYFGTIDKGVGKVSLLNEWEIILDDKNGLSSNAIYLMQSDHLGRIWIGTDYGLNAYMPDAGIQYFLDKSDGLPSNQFYWNACYLHDQQIYFGTTEGLVTFDTEQVELDHHKFPLYISDLVIYNDSIYSIPMHQKRLQYEQEVQLKPQENTFFLQFTGLNFSRPQKTVFRYQLQGVDDQWYEANPDGRTYTYTKLSPGTYRMRVEAGIEGGQQFSEAKELVIQVLPAYYQTYWFWISMLFLVGLLVYLYFYVRMQQEKNKRKQLEKIISERTQYIEKQKIQIEEQRDQLIQLNNDLKEVHEGKIDFFMDIAHEFRTPLTLILGPIAELSKRSHQHPEISERIGILEKNSNYLLHLTDQILDFRKFEKGKFKLHYSQLSLKEYLESLVGGFHALTREKGLTFKVEYFGFKQQDQVQLDPGYFEKVVYNLLSNAFRFAKKKVELVVMEEEDRIKFTFSDDGPGIAPTQLPHVFTRYYTKDYGNRKTGKGYGAGIGLNLSKKIVELHQGEIYVNSREHEGTSFVVELPKKAASGAVLEAFSFVKKHLPVLPTSHSTTEASVPFAEQAKSQKTVLVVEDNAEVRKYIVGILSDEYQVLEAADGASGLERAINFVPDLIISDIMMPVKDGIEMARELKEKIETCHIPVILLTAKSSDITQLEAMKIGVDDFVTKPFVPELLQARVSNLIAQRERLQRTFQQKEVVEIKADLPQDLDREFLQKAEDVVLTYLDQETFNQDFFAREMGICKSLLYKKIKAISGNTPSDFVNKIRVRKSCELLLQPEMMVSAVAAMVGYSDPKYYSRCFRKFMGASPKAYQEQHQRQKST
ncbi:hybrid sensor histidine kinase/response regulator transcription factor [Persicobacter diffluens]